MHGNKTPGIIITRELKDDWLWPEEKYTQLEAWIYLLLSAERVERKLHRGNKLIVPKIGTLTTAITRLGKIWNWDPKTVKRFLNLLEKDGKICSKKIDGRTVITIRQYSDISTLTNLKNERCPQSNPQQKDIQFPSESPTDSPPDSPSNQQQISEKKPISNNSKKTRKSKIFVPPTIDEVISYFVENGYKANAAEKAYLYYNAGNWKDSMGKQVCNWKQKMRGVWFKEENRASCVNGGQISTNDFIIPEDDNNRLTHDQIIENCRNGKYPKNDLTLKQ